MEWIKVGKRSWRSKGPILIQDNRGEFIYVHPEYKIFKCERRENQKEEIKDNE